MRGKAAWAAYLAVAAAAAFAAAENHVVGAAGTSSFRPPAHHQVAPPPTTTTLSVVHEEDGGDVYNNSSSAVSSSSKKKEKELAPFLLASPQEQEAEEERSFAALWYWLISCGLVLFAGCASGLTVGLMGLDPIQLQVLASEGSDEERAGVDAVLQVVRQHHLLLVTLLLANSVAMEALPIFLDRLVPPWAAVLLSVTAILLFGEIIPQALCTGPWQLTIARRSAPFVRVLIAALFVVAWPIAKLLDQVLGHHSQPSYYARAHLKALIRMHERPQGTNSGAPSSALGADEVVVIEGALDMAGKTLQEIMLPMERVFMLEAATAMDADTLELILKTGHSRIPVFASRRNNLKGIILTKTLITVDSSEGIPAGMLTVQRRPIFAKPDTHLYDLLNVFQKGHTHFAFVTPEPEVFDRAFKEHTDIPESAELLGIATLEDVIEELIQEEIYDEFDPKVSRDPNLLIATRSTREDTCCIQTRASLRDLPAILQAAAAAQDHTALFRGPPLSATAVPSASSGLTAPLIQKSAGGGGIFSEAQAMKRQPPRGAAAEAPASSAQQLTDPSAGCRRTGSKTRVMWAAARATQQQQQPPSSEGGRSKMVMVQHRSRRAGSFEGYGGPPPRQESPEQTTAWTTTTDDVVESQMLQSQTQQQQQPQTQQQRVIVAAAPP